MQEFEQLQLSPSTLNALRAMQFTTPTPVQRLAIPELMAGRDLIAQARTGTGKTAAFGIPLIEKLATVTGSGVHALVLVPTRELCIQVAEQLTKLARGTKLRVVAVYGGVGFGQQMDNLRTHNPIVVVATPGRLLDHVERRTLRLDAARVLVLDEADRMLDMGFLPDVERVLRLVPNQRQTALFSATVPDPIRKLSHKFMRNPVSVKAEDGPATTITAEQFRIDLPRSQKPQGLMALFEKEKPESAIVFTRTKHLARRLAKQLGARGMAAVALQGNMSQPQREQAMRQFRAATAKVLVATDIASRGLDVPHVSHVINYDVPVEPEAYVHRVGRTARMGRPGRAFTFVQGDQRREIVQIEKLSGVMLQPYDLGVLPPPGPEPEHDHERPPFRPQRRDSGGRSHNYNRPYPRSGGYDTQRRNRGERDNSRPRHEYARPAPAPQSELGQGRGSDDWN